MFKKIQALVTGGKKVFDTAWHGVQSKSPSGSGFGLLYTDCI